MFVRIMDILMIMRIMNIRKDNVSSKRLIILSRTKVSKTCGLGLSHNNVLRTNLEGDAIIGK